MLNCSCSNVNNCTNVVSHLKTLMMSIFLIYIMENYDMICNGYYVEDKVLKNIH
jgi:hypothetical protein